MKLDGKVALITGAASGIGHGVAKRYVEAGGRVAIADLNTDGAAAAAKELGDKKVAIGVGMDVSKEDQVNAGVEQTVKAFGSIDILVSNAGIQIVYPMEEFPFLDWKKMLAIHLDGAFLTTKACVKHFYPQKSGVLLYMGSVHSHEASPLDVEGGQSYVANPLARRQSWRRPPAETSRVWIVSHPVALASAVSVPPSPSSSLASHIMRVRLTRWSVAYLRSCSRSRRLSAW